MHKYLSNTLNIKIDPTKQNSSFQCIHANTQFCVNSNPFIILIFQQNSLCPSSVSLKGLD